MNFSMSSQHDVLIVVYVSPPKAVLQENRKPPFPVPVPFLFLSFPFLFVSRHGDALGGDASLPKAIFVPQMEQRLRRVAESSSNTRANRAPFRHLLLHGEAGVSREAMKTKKYRDICRPSSQGGGGGR